MRSKFVKLQIIKAEKGTGKKIILYKNVDSKNGIGNKFLKTKKDILVLIRLFDLSKAVI